MPDKTLLSGPPLTRKKYTPAFKAKCVRQVAAGARQTDVALPAPRVYRTLCWDAGSARP